VVPKWRDSLGSEFAGLVVAGIRRDKVGTLESLIAAVADVP
jgi:hypothetical protein